MKVIRHHKCEPIRSGAWAILKLGY
eukprot:COSAG02_NODE_34729_length_479_cov_1.018421_1_plen_24_part_10